jgi:hypothetical protein
MEQPDLGIREILSSIDSHAGNFPRNTRRHDHLIVDMDRAVASRHSVVFG